MLSQLTPLKMSRLRFKTKKVSHQISRDSSSLESNSRTAEPSPITTSRKNLLSTQFSDLEEVCKSSSRPLLERPSHQTLNQLIPLKTSKLRSKTKKEFPQISRDLSLLESNLKTEEPYLTTTSKRNPHSTQSLDLEEVCKSSSRPLLEKPSPSMLSQLTPLRMSRLKSKIRKEFPQTSRDSSLLESNLKMAELCLTITSKKSQLSIQSSDLEVDNEKPL